MVALPLYVVWFAASTLSFDQVTTVPMQLTPGSHIIDISAKRLNAAGIALAEGRGLERIMFRARRYGLLHRHGQGPHTSLASLSVHLPVSF